MKVSRTALIILTRMIITDELCNVTAMMIVIMSITATVTITTVAAQKQYCPSYDIFFVKRSVQVELHIEVFHCNEFWTE